MKKTLILILALISALPVMAQPDRVIPNKPYSNMASSPGYITFNELTGGIGLGSTDADYSKSFFGFNTIHGYQINKAFVLGAGTGASFYNGGMLVPLFVDIRYRFLINRLTPFAFGDGGLLLNFSDFNAGTRIFINPGVAVRYALSKNLAAHIGTGVWLQMGGGGNSRDTFINFKAGITFKPR
jgi:hypothetical protein